MKFQLVKRISYVPCISITDPCYITYNNMLRQRNSSHITSCHIGHWPKLLPLANTGDMGTQDLLHLMNWHGRGHVYPTLHSGIPEVIQLSWSLVNSHHKGYELWRPKPSYRLWGKSSESGRKYARWAPNKSGGVGRSVLQQVAKEKIRGILWSSSCMGTSLDMVSIVVTFCHPHCQCWTQWPHRTLNWPPALMCPYCQYNWNP